jgi:hypothetical protein
MHIIGTEKVRFVTLQKNGSTSLRAILKKNTAIQGWYTTDKDENHRYPFKISDLQNKDITFIFPLRCPIKRKKSAILQKIHAKFGSVNNSKDLEHHVKGFLERYLKYGDTLSYWDCNVFQEFIYDVFRSHKEKQIKANFIFIDINALSTTQLNKFLTNLDSNWKDILIPHENASSNNLFKVEVMKIIKKLSDDNNSGMLNWFNEDNWENYEAENRVYEAIKSSKYYYSVEKLLNGNKKEDSCI